MAAPRIFVSSTCYDLQEVRGNIRDFILSFGYEPMMSDFGDIFYDVDKHVQDSCIEAIKQSDLYVLIVGDNYGSNFHSDKKQTSDIPDSITLAEFKRALDLDKPKMIFVNKFVDYDYRNYKRHLQEQYSEYFRIQDVLDEEVENTKNEIKQKIEMTYPYPKKSYKYIFYFLDKIYDLKIGNAVFPFESSYDIKETLKKQWAGFVQESLKRREELNSPTTIELKRILEKLSKVEKIIETKNFESNKQTNLINIDEIIDELTQKKNLLNDCLKSIFKYEDLFFSINGNRFILQELVTEEKIKNWMNDIIINAKKYKWAEVINVKELFQNFEIQITNEALEWNEENVNYKDIFKLSELFKSMTEEDIEGCLIPIKSYFDESYDLGFPF